MCGADDRHHAFAACLLHRRHQISIALVDEGRAEGRHLLRERLHHVAHLLPVLQLLDFRLVNLRRSEGEHHEDEEHLRAIDGAEAPVAAHERRLDLPIGEHDLRTDALRFFHGGEHLHPRTDPQAIPQALLEAGEEQAREEQPGPVRTQHVARVEPMPALVVLQGVVASGVQLHTHDVGAKLFDHAPHFLDALAGDVRRTDQEDLTLPVHQPSHVSPAGSGRGLARAHHRAR